MSSHLSLVAPGRTLDPLAKEALAVVGGGALGGAVGWAIGWPLGWAGCWLLSRSWRNRRPPVARRSCRSRLVVNVPQFS